MDVFESSTVSTAAATTTKITTKKMTSKKMLSTRTSSITSESAAIEAIETSKTNDIKLIGLNTDNNKIDKNNIKKNIINNNGITTTTTATATTLLKSKKSIATTTIDTINKNNDDINNQNVIVNDDDIKQNLTESIAPTTTVKKKIKKTKKSIDGKENISVKSSFSKFDALQKKNILNIRSSDSSKAQDKFSESIAERESICRSCGKIVYKMEEIKAERNIWHKNCFKCKECNKQLSVDTFESHESLLYCKPHFKLLFAPKAVEDNEPVKPKKPELIIRENQPIELPPDVVRASDKPDLGLEELQQLNVKSRFQMFENYQEQQQQQEQKDINERGNGVKRSATILSKLAKFNAKGMNTGVTDDDLNGIQFDDSHSDNDTDNDDDDDDENLKKMNDDDYDPDLIRAKRAQRERPMHFDQMNDIKTKFEKGHLQSREERREERKQEIQNIRSRLFMGKQARIKEQYQQAVADSEQGKTSIGKKPEIEIGDKAKSIKEKFEKGEIFRDYNEDSNSRVQDDEMAVFESGIGKQSRSIFMELDATAIKSPQLSSNPTTPRTPDPRKQVSPLQEDMLKPFTGENIIKCDEKQDDIKIETSEISSKFNFFETYKPIENRKKEFRITPPRDGVVKMPSPDDNDIDNNINNNNNNNNGICNDDPLVAQQQHTATKMLSKFREMEQKKNHWHNSDDIGLKPLKRFTPPPDENRRIYLNNDNDDEIDENDEEEEEYDDEDEEIEEEEDEEIENNYHSARYDDEFLKAAQSAARAKQLRAKFEKWEANEIKKEMNNGQIYVYDNSEDSQTESAKSLKAKFESMKDQTNLPSKPKVQVNRFVVI